MCALKGIRELCRAGAEAHARGDDLNAEFLLRQAHAQAKGLKSPVLEAKILNTMAVFALEASRAAEAVPLLVLARDMVRGRIGQGNRLHTVISNNLVQAQRASNAES